MRTSVRLIILAAVILTLASCRPKGEIAGRSPGETAFRSRCQSCHRLPMPSRKTPQEWRDWLATHRVKANLSDEELELILGYLGGANAP